MILEGGGLRLLKNRGRSKKTQARAGNPEKQGR